MRPSRRPNVFAWATGAAVVGVFGALAMAPEPANARLVPRVSSDEAVRLVADGSSPLVLAFSLPGCRMCHAALKILRTVASDAPPGVRFAEVDLGEAPALGERYGVGFAPTQLVFADGRLVLRTAALETQTELRQALARASGRACRDRSPTAGSAAALAPSGVPTCAGE